jgi:hypothetical protein
MLTLSQSLLQVHERMFVNCVLMIVCMDNYNASFVLIKTVILQTRYCTTTGQRLAACMQTSHIEIALSTVASACY